MTDQISEQDALKEFTAHGGVTEDQAKAEFEGARRKQVRNDFMKATGSSDFDIYAGDLADQFFGKTSAGRIMSAFGSGAQQDWGTQGFNLEGTLRGIANSSKVYQEFRDQHKGLIKGFNEGFIRPWTHVIDNTVNAAQEALIGLTRGTGQIGTELVNNAKENIERAGPQVGGIPNVFDYAKGMVGEGLQAMEPHQDTYTNPYTGETQAQSGTWALLPEFSTGFPTQASLARSRGIIGEGEAGFFNTKPLTPKNIEERIGAADEIGAPEAPPGKPHTDPHFVARLIDPDAFNEWDRLQKVKEKSIDLKKFNYWRQRQQEEFARQEKAVLYKTNGDESALSAEDAAVLNDIREKKKTAAQTPTEEEINLRQKALEADVAQRDLIPRVRDAKTRGEEYLASETPEGAAFRDYIQGEMLKHDLETMKVAEESDDALNHAQSLMPDPNNSPVYNNNPKYDFSTPVQNLDQIDRTPLEADPEASLYTKLEGEGKGEGSGVGYEGEGPVGVRPGPTEGPTKVSGLAEDIQQRARELGYGGEDFGGSEFTRIQLEEQANKVDELISTSHAQAKRIAYGREAAPPDVDPFMVAIAVEKKAQAEGDFETLRRLANSTYTSEGSRAAQVMRILQERDPYSPAALMSDVDKTRKAQRTAAANVHLGRLKKLIEDTTTYDAEALERFAKSIQCDY